MCNCISNIKTNKKRIFQPLPALSKDAKLPNYPAPIHNLKLSLFKKIPPAVFGLIADHLTFNEINSFLLTSKRGQQLFHNTLRKEAEPRSKKLLGHIIRGELAEAKGYIEWHYNVKMVVTSQNEPDVLYIKTDAAGLRYSITTSEGCIFNNYSISEKELAAVKIDDVKQINPFCEKIASPDSILLHLRDSYPPCHLLQPYILTITAKRGHTPPKHNRGILWRKDQVIDNLGRKIEATPYRAALSTGNRSMADMLANFLKMAAGGSEELSRQCHQQFSNDDEKRFEYKTNRDLMALQEVTKKIEESKAQILEHLEKDCAPAIKRFKETLDLHEDIHTGYYLNLQILIKAFQLNHQKFVMFGGIPNSPKNKLFWNHVIKHLHSLLPICDTPYSLRQITWRDDLEGAANFLNSLYQEKLAYFQQYHIIPANFIKKLDIKNPASHAEAKKFGRFFTFSAVDPKIFGIRKSLQQFSNTLSEQLQKGNPLEVLANNTSWILSSSAKRRSEIAKGLFDEIKACYETIEHAIKYFDSASALPAIATLKKGIAYYQTEYKLVSTQGDKLFLVLQNLEPIIANCERMLGGSLSDEKTVGKNMGPS